MDDTAPWLLDALMTRTIHGGMTALNAEAAGSLQVGLARVEQRQAGGGARSASPSA